MIAKSPFFAQMEYFISDSNDASSDEILHSFKKKNRAVIREFERLSSEEDSTCDSLGVIVNHNFDTPNSVLMCKPNATSTIDGKKNKKNRKRVSFATDIKTVIDESTNSSESQFRNGTNSLKFSINSSKSKKNDVISNSSYSCLKLKSPDQLRQYEIGSNKNLPETSSDSDYTHPLSLCIDSSSSSADSRQKKNKRKAQAEELAGSSVKINSPDQLQLNGSGDTTLNLLESSSKYFRPKGMRHVIIKNSSSSESSGSKKNKRSAQAVEEVASSNEPAPKKPRKCSSLQSTSCGMRKVDTVKSLQIVVLKKQEKLLDLEIAIARKTWRQMNANNNTM